MGQLRHRSIRPLTVAGAGVLLVALDFRIRAADLVPDPLGWALVAVGAASLGLLMTSRWAALAAVLSLSEFLLSYRVIAVDPSTGVEVRGAVEGSAVPRKLLWDGVSDVRTLVMAAAVAAGGMALVTLATTVAQRATAHARSVDDLGLGLDPRADRATQQARWLRLGGVAAAIVWAVPYLVVALTAVVRPERFDPVWNGQLEFVAFAGVLVLVVFAGVLIGVRDETWAVPAGRVQPSRWEGRLSGAPGGPEPGD